MDLTHHFTVPTGVEDTWAHFQDIASVAQCFPGAQVTSVEGDTFQGTVKVKLGPIALVYNGTGTFVEKDDAAHRFLVDAKGKDKRGNGTAGAKVTLSMAPASDGGTEVEVITDLAVTGKPAQFGRGVMQDVSDKLLGQFVACLEQRLGEVESSAPEAPAAPAAAAVAAEPAVAAGPQSVAAPADPAPAADAAPADTTPAAVETPISAPAPATAGAGTVGNGAAPASDADGEAGRHAAPRAAPTARPAVPSAQPAAQADDAINLGATVLPILIKSYWKQGAVALVVLLVIIWLLVR